MTDVVDVSKYQSDRLSPYIGNWSPANWDTSRIDFDLLCAAAAVVIIRVGDGMNLDPCFERFRSALTARHHPWGIYHLYRPNISAADQVAAIRTWQPALPPAGVWGDLEVTGSVGGTELFTRTTNYLSGLDAVYGQVTGIYSGTWYLDRHFSIAQQAVWAHRPGWWAGYPSLNIPRGWQASVLPYVLHQFTSEYTWPGLPRPADANRLNPALDLADLVPTLQPEPEPEPAPEIDVRAALRTCLDDLIRLVETA